MRATTSTDVKVSLLGTNETLMDCVTIFKERNKNNCLIKPKRVIPYHIWFQIQTQVKKLGGRWSKKNGFWVVPLNG